MKILCMKKFSSFRLTMKVPYRKKRLRATTPKGNGGWRVGLHQF